MKAVVRFMDSHQVFEYKIFNAFLLAILLHRFFHKTWAAVCLFLFQTVGEQQILLALPCGGMTEIPFREYVPNPKNLVFSSMHK